LWRRVGRRPTCCSRDQQLRDDNFGRRRAYLRRHVADLSDRRGDLRGGANGVLNIAGNPSGGGFLDGGGPPRGELRDPGNCPTDAFDRRNDALVASSAGKLVYSVIAVVSLTTSPMRAAECESSAMRALVVCAG